MFPSRVYDLIVCCLSQGLMKKFLTSEERKKYRRKEEENREDFILPSSLLIEFLRARDRYFQKIFSYLRSPKIKEIIIFQIGKKITIDNIYVEIETQNGKVRRIPIRKLIKEIQFVR